MLGSNAQGFVHDGFGDTLNVALVLEPLTVAHVGAETKEKSAASERGIFTEKLTNKLQGRASVRVPHLVEFFLHVHTETNLRRELRSVRR